MTENNTEKKVKLIKGEVVSIKMDKTIVIRTENIRTHKRYGKRYSVHNKLKAHCELGNVELGDMAFVASCKPISKTKCFIVKEVVKKKEG